MLMFWYLYLNVSYSLIAWRCSSNIIIYLFQVLFLSFWVVWKWAAFVAVLGVELKKLGNKERQTEESTQILQKQSRNTAVLIVCCSWVIAFYLFYVKIQDIKFYFASNLDQNLEHKRKSSRRHVFHFFHLTDLRKKLFETVNCKERC